MRYARAVEKLRLLAQACERFGAWPDRDESFLVEMYAFGGVLEGTDPLEVVQVAGVIQLPPEEVPWSSSRYIQGPVRIWSRAGTEEAALDALAERRFADLRRLVPDPVDQRLQLRDDVDGGW